ncbi:MAG: PriCT-2 domain-containing protein [Bacteroidaceae bacterium]|nr:PriCT-2 domain-containing protein [Bacteroidaceae bacterium]
MKSTNAFSDLEHLVLVAGRISEAGLDLTCEYDDWVKITFACASLGEAAREPYHTICSQYPTYRREECDEKFNNCLRTGRGDVRVATVFQMAKDAGIDVSLPKGRRPKTAEQKAAEEKDRFETIRKWLTERFEFRLNTISEQIEVRPKGAEVPWQDMDDRRLDSLLTALHADKIYVSKANLETYIGSELISPAYNPITAYAESLKPWNPRQKDYITYMFGHLGLAENEHRDLLLGMAKKWYVWLVAVATDQETSNQIMLILSGEQEGTGKTYFVESFLPRPLRRYLHHVVELARYKDKDELLALARNIVCFIDEIQLNATTLNKLKNFVGGGAATAVTERTHFGHFAARRKVHASWISTTNREVFLPESSGDRRFVVLPVTHRGRNYKTLPQERAFAQAFYLATHPKAFNLEITSEEIEKLKEINQKYVQEDLCTVSIPTVLRHPKEGDQVQAITNAEIISWLNSRYGSNREFTPTKVGNAMKKCGFEKRKTNKGMRYFVVRVMMDSLEKESKEIANQELKPELPF